MAVNVASFPRRKKIHYTTLTIHTITHLYCFFLFQIIDFLISAYRCGSFDKIIEFINLRQRLSSSQQFAIVNVEKTLVELLVESSSHGQALQIMTAHQIDPEKDEIPWVELIDNRDFKVMVSWDPQDK